MFASKDSLLTRPSGYNIARSVRLRSSASGYFSRTPASATNRKTWTWSAWVKRGTLSSGFPVLFMGGATQSDTGATSISFAPNDRIYVQGYNTNWIISNASYRDPSAWYHIVVAMDSTQATGTNRLKLYVNGSEVSYSTYNNLTQNTDYGINQAASHTLAYESVAFGNTYFDGYMTEVNFVDGQQLTPSSFGSTNAITGVWQPAKYTGTYGTNGFYLNFSDNSSVTTSSNVGIGKDFSGNGNYWTSNNINVTAYSGTPPNNVNYDSMVDSPTVGATSSNYCVLNPLTLAGSGYTLSNGNLDISSTAVASVYSTVAVNTGKYYAEFTLTTAPSSAYAYVGVRSVTGGLYVYRSSDGQYYDNSTYSSYGASYTTNDVIGVAVDGVNGTITFYKNNASQGQKTGLTIIGDTAYYITPSTTAATGAFSANFGQRPFSYTPPTGYVALNTYNLPASTITNGAAYMAATLYTGTGSSLTVSNAVNGVSFQPDFVWIKRRDGGQSHQLYDINRGVKQALYSNLTSAEVTEANGLSAFTSSGFTVISDIGVNTSGGTYVGWQWKKGASSGFDIVSQTLATTGINTITHSLNAVPTMVLAKKTSAGAEQWLVYQSSGTTQSQYLGLNTTAAVATSGNLWGSSAFTSSQIYFNGTSGNTYVFYIFAPVAGYLAFGSYTGNGSSDGPFVYTGFRPRFVMVKNTTNSAGATNWVMQDSSRNGFNPNKTLYANAASAEDSSAYFDILSNGFKVRETFRDANTSGDTYIYMTFAENPFKNALAR